MIFPWLEKVLSFFQVFQVLWEPCRNDPDIVCYLSLDNKMQKYNVFNNEKIQSILMKFLYLLQI